MNITKSKILIFEHDFYTECCSLLRTEKGIKVGEVMHLAELA